MTLTDCTISGNSGSFGGGLTNDATATLTNCTISFNSALDGGGGVSNSGNGPGNADDAHAHGLHDQRQLRRARRGLVQSQRSRQPGPGDADRHDRGPQLADGGDPSDIGGRDAANVTGSFNLVGTGGSGGIQGGVQGNIVLTNLAGLGLAGQDDYGGPTQTIALLPGSAAIGMGTPVAGLTTDQRGFALDVARPDIGAFQSRTAAAGGRSGDRRRCARPACSTCAGPSTWPTSWAGDQTITFDPAVFSTPRTITLTAGRLELSNTAGTDRRSPARGPTC